MFGTSTATVAQFPVEFNSSFALALDNAPAVEFSIPLDEHIEEPDAPAPAGRDYRAHVKALFDAVSRKCPGFWTGAELASVTVPYPRYGDYWGDWHFDAERLTLDYKPNGTWRYEVDLERINDSASLLDWIFQVNGHHFYEQWPSDVMQDLLDALDAIFRPQANLCSWGQSKRIKPSQFLGDKLRKGTRP